jgi:hypothetical protein
MNLFMSFLKRVYECPPSGVPKEEWPNIAAENFHEHHDRHFKFLHCVSILNQLPKFDPGSAVDPDTVIEIDDEDVDMEDGDKKPSARNKIGNPMGANSAVAELQSFLFLELTAAEITEDHRQLPRSKRRKF